MPRPTVILKLGGLGDMLMLSPSLKAFSESFPGQEVVLITGSSNKTVLASNPAVSKQYMLNDADLFRGGIMGKLRQTLRLFWLFLSLRPSEVFILHRDYRYNFIALLALIPHRYGFSRDLKGAFLNHALPNDQSRHETDKYRDLFSLKPRFVAKNYGMQLYPTEAETAQAVQFCRTHFPKQDKSVVALAIGGAFNAKMSSENKRWSLENYTELVSLLLNAGIHPVFVGGPSDKAVVEKLLAGLPGGRPDKVLYTDACGIFSVAGTYALLQQCQVLISNDCGPMHIGSAAGIPVIALFGPTDPAEYRPIQHKLSYTFWPGKDLPCAPCYRHGYFPPCSHVTCMKLIKPGQVFARLEKVLFDLTVFESELS